MAHTDYSKMEANHKARRTAERQDRHANRAKVRVSLADFRIDPDNIVLPTTRNHVSNARCCFCGTPGYWCTC